MRRRGHARSPAFWYYHDGQLSRASYRTRAAATHALRVARTVYGRPGGGVIEAMSDADALGEFRKRHR